MVSQLSMRQRFIRIVGNFSRLFPYIRFGLIVCKLLVLFVAVNAPTLAGILDLILIVVDLLASIAKCLVDRYEFIDGMPEEAGESLDEGKDRGNN